MTAARPDPERQRARLDYESANVIGRFAVCGLFISAWYAFWSVQSTNANLALMAVTAGAAVATTALLRGEWPQAGCLTRWDEAAAWLGIAALARALAL